MTTEDSNQKLRTTAKAIGIGLIVSVIGIWIPIILLVLIPGVYGIVAWTGFLIIFILIASGRKGHERSKDFRRDRFRSVQIPAPLFLRGLVLASLFVIIGQSLLMVTFRLVPYPREAFLAGTNYDELSLQAAWIAIILSALGAGVYEEIGFRGYMQKPLEEELGIVPALGITSVVFMLLHLNQAWSTALLIQLFLLSVLFGIIAYVTKSLIPGIIAHFVLDIFNFGYWWSDVIGSFDRVPISESGVDAHFIFWSVVLVLSLLGFAMMTISASRLQLGDKDTTTKAESMKETTSDYLQAQVQ